MAITISLGGLLLEHYLGKVLALSSIFNEGDSRSLRTLNCPNLLGTASKTLYLHIKVPQWSSKSRYSMRFDMDNPYTCQGSYSRGPAFTYILSEHCPGFGPHLHPT